MRLLKKIEAAIDVYPSSIYIINEQLEQLFPAHQHKKSQLLLTSGGMAFLNTKDKQYYIPARHYVWIPQGMEHNVKFNTRELTIRNIYFRDEKDLKHPFYGQIGIYPITGLLWEMMRFAEKWQGHLFPGSWEYEFLLTMKHLLAQTPGQPFTILLPTTDDKRMQEITGYIQQHIGDELTLPIVSSLFGFSLRSFTRLFQQHLDISFLQYIKMARIVRAMELLLQKELNISEIAYEVGYSSIAAFSNTFQQLVNMRPSDFQQLDKTPNVQL